MQNWKKNKKRKKNTICEHNCANCSCQNVCFFSAFLIFAVFGISLFFRDVFWLVSQNQKIPKKQSKQNKKQEQKEGKRCKAKRNEMLWFKTTQDNKQKNKNKRASWNNKQTQQKEKARTRKRKWKTGRKKENNKRETQKEKGKKGGRPKKG